MKPPSQWPLTSRAAGTPRGARLRARLLDPLLQLAARTVAERPASGVVTFGEAADDISRQEVYAMRLRTYERRLPYLLAELDGTGQDELDPTSFVFTARRNGRIVATVRATPYPFEILRYIDEPLLARYLGPGWRTEHVEWSRLLVDDSCHLNRLMPALITYAGLRLFAVAGYRGYFGYTRDHVRRLLAGFEIEDDLLTFSIPKRGDHTYRVVKGRFGADVARLLRTSVRRLYARGDLRPARARPGAAPARDRTGLGHDTYV